MVQRAAIHIQSSGREEVTGAYVLIAMFAERESHAVLFLQEQDMTRFDAVNYTSHGIAKAPGRSRPLSVQTDAREHQAQKSRREQIGSDAPKPVETTLAEQAEKSAKQTRKVFVGYSHRDVRWISRLEVHLKPIVDIGLISHWHDGRIVPGSKWREEIKLAIETAKIAVLLVSADFLASEFISRNEVPPLLKAAEGKGCHILPIIVGPCRFTRTAALAEFQAVNLASRPLSGMNAHEREALFLRVADTIETILQSDPS